MNNDETGRVTVEVPKRDKEIAKAKLDHGGISREVRKTITRIAHGVEISERERLKEDIKTWRDERRATVHKKQSLENQIDEFDVKIDRAETQLDELRDKQGEYEGALQIIEEDMHKVGMCVWEEHAKVEHAASLGDCSVGDVMDDLQDRNPDLSESQFSEGV